MQKFINKIGRCEEVLKIWNTKNIFDYIVILEKLKLIQVVRPISMIH